MYMYVCVYVGTNLTLASLCCALCSCKVLLGNGKLLAGLGARVAPNKGAHQSGGGEQFDAPNMLLPSAAWSPLARTGAGCRRAVRFLLLPIHARKEKKTGTRQNYFTELDLLLASGDSVWVNPSAGAAALSVFGSDGQ